MSAAAEARGLRVTGRSVRGGALECIVDVSSDAPWFHGHFPGHPVLPAVAQLCDIVLAQVLEGFPGGGRVAGASRIKFARIVRPGDQLVLRLRRDVAQHLVHFELQRGEELCAGGTLRFEDA